MIQDGEHQAQKTEKIANFYPVVVVVLSIVVVVVVILIGVVVAPVAGPTVIFFVDSARNQKGRQRYSNRKERRGEPRGLHALIPNHPTHDLFAVQVVFPGKFCDCLLSLHGGVWKMFFRFF